MTQTGYIAFYKQKRIEIPLSIGDLWRAKEEAVRIFKVPKSQQGLLAIVPGYKAEVINDTQNQTTT